VCADETAPKGRKKQEKSPSHLRRATNEDASRYRAVERHHQVVEAQCGPAPGLRKCREQRRVDGPRQPVVAGDFGDVEREDAAGSQMPACELEELARCQVERHIRLPVRIDDNQVVSLTCSLEERPPVGRVDMEARVVVKAEETPACLGHRRVELDAVDRHARIEQSVDARDRAAGISDHEHVARGVA
jgi:hypothetical protein